MCQIPNIGPVAAKQLIQTIGSAKEVLQTKQSTLQNIEGIGIVKAKSIANFNDYAIIDSEMKFIEKHGITPLFFQDEDKYPTQLKQCIDAPILLYYKGSIGLGKQKIVSIVGRRKNTDYGKRITQDLIEQLKEYNPIICSGLAVGIDGIAHKAALKNEMNTVAVLAHGLQTIYPPNHASMAKEMIVQGGLLTEYCSFEKAVKENFPSRNRIVAGMADVTIVVETDVKGGSMITANLANGYNKEVMAYPGSIYSDASSGCNLLIKSLKANMVTHADDVAEICGWKKQNKKNVQRQLFIDLTDTEKKVVELLQQHIQLSVDELTNSGISPAALAMATLNLEMNNILVMLPGKSYKLAE